jgi:hypothetical protein
VPVLLIAGVGLVVFGAFVLLRFPDRPGGTIRWHGVEVSSVGGGLPLIVLGVVAIATATLRGPGETAGTGGTAGATGPATNTAAPSTPEPPTDAACFDRYFANIPKDRLVALEEGAQDIDVVGPSQSKQGTVGIRLDALGRPIGALRFQFFPGSGDVFKIETVVDSQCRETEEFSNVSRPSDRRTLQNWDTVRVQLGGRFYELRFGGGATIRLNFIPVTP